MNCPARMTRSSCRQKSPPHGEAVQDVDRREGQIRGVGTGPRGRARSWRENARAGCCPPRRRMRRNSARRRSATPPTPGPPADRPRGRTGRRRPGPARRSALLARSPCGCPAPRRSRPGRRQPDRAVLPMGRQFAAGNAISARQWPLAFDANTRREAPSAGSANGGATALSAARKAIRRRAGLLAFAARSRRRPATGTSVVAAEPASAARSNTSVSSSRRARDRTPPESYQEKSHRSAPADQAFSLSAAPAARCRGFASDGRG